MLTGHVLILRQDCPHCGKQTLCKINTLHGHARCLECGGQVHERERGVGGATDEGSLADITQEGHSQKKDSRKEVSREENGETLGSMAARSPWKSFGRNWKLGGTSSAVEKVPAPCAGLIAGKIALQENTIFPLLAGQAFRPKAPYSPRSLQSQMRAGGVLQEFLRPNVFPEGPVVLVAALPLDRRIRGSLH